MEVVQRQLSLAFLLAQLFYRKIWSTAFGRLLRTVIVREAAN